MGSYASRRRRVRSSGRSTLGGLAVGVAATLQGCALVANLAQFDGAVEGDAKAPGAGSDTSVGVDALGDDAIGDDVVQAADGSPDAAADMVDASSADAAADTIDAGTCNTMWPDAGTNVVTNPDFESGGTGWVALYGGTFAVTSATAHCGTYSGELSNRTAFFNALATNMPATPGNYNVAVWVRQDGTATVSMAIGGVCAQADGGTNYPSGPQLAVAPNTWTFVSGSLTVPTGCTSMQFFVGQPTSATAPFPDLFADEVYVGQ